MPRSSPRRSAPLPRLRRGATSRRSELARHPAGADQSFVLAVGRPPA
jgi:hypothetical protein